MTSTANHTTKSTGNFFYRACGMLLVVLALLFTTSCHKEHEPVEISMHTFFENMLAKGDVTDVIIVNKSYARIFVNPDSAATLDRYKEPKTGRAYFSNKEYKGTQFFTRLASIEVFLTRMETVQSEAGIPKDKQVYARSVEETNLLSELLPWLLPLIVLLIVGGAIFGIIKAIRGSNNTNREN